MHEMSKMYFYVIVIWTTLNIVKYRRNPMWWNKTDFKFQINMETDTRTFTILQERKKTCKSMLLNMLILLQFVPWSSKEVFGALIPGR